MAKGPPLNESLPILLVPDVLFHDSLLHALGLLDVFPIGLKDAIHLGTQPNILNNRAPSTLILHLPQYLLVCSVVQGMFLWVVRCVIELGMHGHIPVDVPSLNLEEKAVGVGVQKLATVSILDLHLIVVEVIHEGL